jgi:rubrerythrin
MKHFFPNRKKAPPFANPQDPAEVLLYLCFIIIKTMIHFKSIADVLDFAMKSEQESVDFYYRMTAMTNNAEMKRVFTQLAHEEMGHKSRLQQMLEKQEPIMKPERVADLRISDYLPDVLPGPRLTYSEALIVAMKKENAAARLYTDLAARAADDSIRLVFEGLIREEQAHKLRFETEYDEYVLKEN